MRRGLSERFRLFTPSQNLNVAEEVVDEGTVGGIAAVSCTATRFGVCGVAKRLRDLGTSTESG